MSNKVMIIGTGNVGASIGFSLVSQRTAVNELVLTDINMEDAEGEAMDLRDTLAVAPTQMKIHSGTYESDAGDCDIIIITAGVPQKPGETRMELLAKNSAIMKSMIEPIMAAGFNGIFLVVSNPMDVMTYLTKRYSGLPDEQVLGSGTVLDSARLRYKIAEKLDVSPRSVHAYQIGEHGDSEFALWSEADVGRQSLEKLLSSEQRAEVEEFARHEAYDIINKKGATYYGIGACVTKIVNAILEDTKEVLPVSTYDHYSDSYFGWPSVIGRKGVIRRCDIDLTEEESVKLQKSINAIKEAIAECPED
ncbi:MAG: L-lactate dehydrogenase [Candidatus Saccharibacteria bacterium]|nr:L-lactate dehydrogenase [Candidatus Saccharibacteria bacterium]